MLRILVKNPAVPVSVIIPDTVKFGYLYNWFAASDVRNLANTGWEVASQSHYSTLKTYLTANGYGYGGSGDDVGKSVASILGWNISATAGTVGNLPENNNASGFNLPPSGIRQVDGTFVGLHGNWYGWQITEYAASTGYYSVIAASQSYFNIGFGGDKNEGQAIRLIKTTTSLTHGQTGTYLYNNGKVGSTICIGTQEWLLYNLAETKFRNGDLITKVTDGTAWAALTTDGYCAYDNDESNV